MSASSSPPRTEGSAPGQRASYANPGMRVSDAERAEVADRLSRHYGDGRLDQAEFDQRLDQAMRAKTQSDLHGLFADLPHSEPSEAPVPEWHGPRQPDPDSHPHRHSRARRRIPFLILVIVIAVAIGHSLAPPFTPWLWIALLAFLALRLGPWRRRR